MSVLIPTRRAKPEILDDPLIDPGIMTRSMRDVVRSNRVFGGSDAVMAELAAIFPLLPRNATLLDVGTGLGDIPASARKAAAAHGIVLDTLGVDAAEELARASRSGAGEAVCADALSLPFSDGSFDVVTCSQVLHHFAGAGAMRLVRELNRVARMRVVISDLRRSWFAAAGLWIASFPLGFHPVSRHDGVLSVLRGFTPRELRSLVQQSVEMSPRVRRRLLYRLTTSWAPR